MKTNSLCVRGLFVSFVGFCLLFAHGCAPTTAGRSGSSGGLQSGGKNNLSGVWTGTSIVGCTPLRMGGPRRCGATANIMFTIVEERADAITGFYASDSGALEETGRIVVSAPLRSTRLWLRVMMNDHSSCIFNANLPRDAMKGAYLCFHDGSSLERGYWTARRSY